MPYTNLTDRTIANEPFSEGGQRILRDSGLNGFFVMIGRRSKTFMVQGDLRKAEQRKSIRVKVGRFGTISTKDAKARAKIMLGRISSGEDPRPKRSAQSNHHNDPTLWQAWTAYRDGHMQRKRRSEKTIAGYADHVERLMSAWRDQPLSVLGKNPGKVRAFHSALTDKAGPYMANACMRSLRAIYNHARKSARGLPPENPVFAVDWNPESRRESGMGIDDLSGWFDQLRVLDNPLRRELHLLLLLSGSRPGAIKSAKIDHIDFRRRELFIPNPKGGEQKAFSIPLSREMVRCLVRTIRLGRMMFPNGKGDWLFPADSKSGFIVEHKEHRSKLSHWGNELRQTYRTVGQVAGVSSVDMHLLMNHSLPSLNAGYITRSKLVHGHLREAQQMISTKIIESVTDTGSGSAEAWPHGYWHTLDLNRIGTHHHSL